MNRVLAVSFLLAGLCCFAAAQDKSSFEIFGGYSFLHAPGAVASAEPPNPDLIFPHHEPAKSAELNGWEASFAYRRGRLSLVFDGGARYASPNTVIGCTPEGFFFGCTPTPQKVKLHIEEILAGPRFYFGSEHFNPFVHALFGYSHYSADFQPVPSIFEPGFTLSGHGFAAALGGGVDLKIAPHFGYRLFQADYFPTHLNRKTEHNLRVSTGLLLKF